MRLANGAWVIVADGAKALTLVNQGDADIINLRRVTVTEEHHPRTANMGSDRPGLTPAPSSGRAGRVAQTDWHDRAESAFLHGVAARLDEAAQAGRFRDLVVIAPPRALAELRDAFTEVVKKAIVAELAKDLTAHTIPDIEAAIGAA